MTSGKMREAGVQQINEEGPNASDKRPTHGPRSRHILFGKQGTRSLQDYDVRS